MLKLTYCICFTVYISDICVSVLSAYFKLWTINIKDGYRINVCVCEHWCSVDIVEADQLVHCYCH
jgi:hypothetical protein